MGAKLCDGSFRGMIDRDGSHHGVISQKDSLTIDALLEDLRNFDRKHQADATDRFYWKVVPMLVLGKVDTSGFYKNVDLDLNHLIKSFEVDSAGLATFESGRQTAETLVTQDHVDALTKLQTAI